MGFESASMEPADGADLMARVARDDEGAFDALVAAYAPKLLRFARRMLGGDAAEAEDAVQEAFVRVWRARRRWRPSACVSTYLFTIVARLCLNRRRWLARRPALDPIEGEGAPAQPGDAAPGPERLAVSRQLGAALAAELAALPRNQRAAILLRHEGGLRYDEIAAALDTSPGAVESLLSRARARLRSRLAGWVSEGNPGSRG